MMVGATVLSSRSSFVLAALVVSWGAVVLLALVTANLHFRLAHLERAEPAAPTRGAPFQQVLGRQLTDLLGSDAVRGTRLALVLSANCATCDRLVEWLGRSTADVPVALLWRDGTPAQLAALPTGAVVVEDGAGVSSTLGASVTPFALVADEGGRVVRARPVGSIDAFASLVDDLGHSALLGNEAGRPLVSPSSPTTQQLLKGASR